MANPEGGGGGGGRGADHPPQKKHKSIEFLSNTGLDPLKNHKATNPYSVSSHRGWWADNCPLLVLFGSPHSKNKTKKKCKSWTPSEKLSGSVHAEERFSNEMVHFPLLELQRELTLQNMILRHLILL